MKFNISFFFRIGRLVVLVLFIFSVETIYAQDGMRILCGITMQNPIQAIAAEVESKYGVPIQIISGGSGWLKKALLIHKHADLYLPGSDSYIQELEMEYPDLILKKAYLGKNQAAIFVKKGNPKSIPVGVKSFLIPEYRVAIGSPRIGSIGKITRKILGKEGIYAAVFKRARIARHSKALLSAFNRDRADLAINWYPVSIGPENKDLVTAYPLSEKYEASKKLILVILKYTKNRKVAEAFLNLAKSKKGNAIFLAHGFPQ